MPEIRVQDEQGTVHVFPDGSTPEMIAQAMHVKPPAPPAAGPHVNMQEHDLIGPIANPSSPSAMVKDAAKGAYQVSAPGIAASLLQKRAPQLAAKLPAAMTQNATPADQLAGQVFITGLMGMEGGLGEPDVPPMARQALAPKPPSAPNPGVQAATNAVVDTALHAIHPGLPFVKRIIQKLMSSEKAPTAPAPIPQTEGTPWGSPILKQPEPTPAATPVEASATRPDLGPRPVHGESALTQVLTGMDNASLLKIAKSRGINVAQEATLKPGVADNLLVKKIIGNFTPEQLDEIGSQYLENTKFKHSFGDIGPEAWQTLSLKSYFPDLKIPATQLARTQKAIEGAAINKMPARIAPAAKKALSEDSDLKSLLEQSVVEAKNKRLVSQ